MKDTSVHPSPRIGAYSSDNGGGNPSQVAVVSGGIESVLASPSPPGNQLHSIVQSFKTLICLLDFSRLSWGLTTLLSLYVISDFFY